MDKTPAKKMKSGGAFSTSTSGVSPNGSILGGVNESPSDAYDVHHLLEQFWPYQAEKIDRMSQADFRETKISQELPLARIKKIMKLDEDVKAQMISAEAPVLFAKACEMFIEELTVRAWIHTEDNKRKTLQKNDIALAISKHDQFDFLIDIVPREEIAKGGSSGGGHAAGSNASPVESPVKRVSNSPAHGGQFDTSSMPMFVQVAAPGGTSQQQATMQTLQLPSGQILQAQTMGGQPLQLVQGANGELQLLNVVSCNDQQAGQVVSQQAEQQVQSSSPFAQAYQQIVAPDGTVHHLPIQLSPAQLNYLKQHLNGATGGQQQQVHVLQNPPSSSAAFIHSDSPSRAQQQQQPAFFIQGQVVQRQQQSQTGGIQQQGSEPSTSNPT